MSGKVTRHSAVIFMTRLCQIKTMNHLYFIYFSLTKGNFCTSAAPTHTHFGMRYLLFFLNGAWSSIHTCWNRSWVKKSRKNRKCYRSVCLLSPAYKYDPTSLILQTKETNFVLTVCVLLSLHLFPPLTHMPQSSIMFALRTPYCTTHLREPPDMSPGVSSVFLSMAQCSCGYSFPPLWFHLLCFGFELHSAVISSASWVVWTHGALFLCLLHGMHFSSLTSSLVKTVPYPLKVGTRFSSSRRLLGKSAGWKRAWALNALRGQRFPTDSIFQWKAQKKKLNSFSFDDSYLSSPLKKIL